MPQAIHFVQARRPFLTQTTKLESSYIRVTRKFTSQKLYKIMVCGLLEVFIFFYNDSDERKPRLDLTVRNAADLKRIDPVDQFGC